MRHDDGIFADSDGVGFGTVYKRIEADENVFAVAGVDYLAAVGCHVVAFKNGGL